MTEVTIFATALEKSEPAERAAYLAEACGEDTALRQRVEGLLAAHDMAGEFLGQPAAQDVTGAYATERNFAVSEASNASPGTIIAGRYKLLQQIGEGGMGSVWMADQTEPIKRRVAVKLIRTERGQSKRSYRDSRPNGRPSP